MDPKHHDRWAFMRIVSRQFTKGMKLLQVRTGKQIKVANAFASSSAVDFMWIPPTLPSFVEIVGTVRGRNSGFLLTLVLH